MSESTDDVRIESLRPLLPPAILMEELPASGTIADRVWSVERLPALAADARARLRALDLDNVHVVVGDGRYGYAAAAPYDAILVAAATPTPPPALLRQLARDGRLVIPLGPSDVQELEVWQRTASGTSRQVLCACCFVPLIGER